MDSNISTIFRVCPKDRDLSTLKGCNLNSKVQTLTSFGNDPIFKPASKKASFAARAYALSQMTSRLAFTATSAEKIEKVKPFEDYINFISDKKLQQLCVRILNETPDHFFTTPATTSNKFHPPDERVPGGIYKHLQRAVVMAMHALRRYGLDQDQKMVDIAITASLLHDSPFRVTDNKDGTFKTNPTHAVENARYIEKAMTELNIEPETIKLVCAGVGLHMGIWDKHTDKEWFDRYKEYKEHPIAKVVQEADFYASRRNITTDPSIEEMKLILGK